MTIREWLYRSVGGRLDVAVGGLLMSLYSQEWGNRPGHRYDNRDD